MSNSPWATNTRLLQTGVLGINQGVGLDRQTDIHVAASMVVQEESHAGFYFQACEARLEVQQSAQRIAYQADLTHGRRSKWTYLYHARPDTIQMPPGRP